LFMSAQKGAKATGYELNYILYLFTKIQIRRKRLKNMVTVKYKSMYKADLSNVDVVFAYLMPKPMEDLSKKLFMELPNNAKIISHCFIFPDKKPIKTDGKIYVYEVKR